MQLRLIVRNGMQYPHVLYIDVTIAMLLCIVCHVLHDDCRFVNIVCGVVYK